MSHKNKPCMTPAQSAKWKKLRQSLTSPRVSARQRQKNYRAMKRMESKAKPCFVV